MRTQKMRLVSALLAVAMMFVMMPVGAFADDATIAQLPACEEGEFDDSASGLRYKIKTDAVDEVAVVGPVEVRTERVIPDTVEYNGKTYTVTEIADNAFSCYGIGDREDLNTPYIPFVGRPDFVSVTIPRTVTRIGKYAFYACTEWGQFNPSSDGETFVTDIGLQNITIEAGSQLRIIDDAAFAGCYTLKEFTVPSSVESIGEDAFYDCACIKSLTFEDGSMLQSIGKNAFHWNDGLTNVELPEGLKTIGDGAFYDCTGLENITIPGSVETIGENAFDVDTAKGHESSLKDINYTGTEEQWNKLTADNNSNILENRTLRYEVTVENGTARVLDENGNEVIAAGDQIFVEKGQTVTIKAKQSIVDGMKFANWEVRKGNVELVDAELDETTFVMPGEPVEVAVMLKDEASDDGIDAATVVTGVVLGAGAAVLTYHIGTELYAEQVLGKGVSVPKTREDVALKAWELAGKPAVELNGEPLSEAAQAEKWAVESGLMQNDAEGNFNGTKKMNKLKALRVLDKAQKMG